MEQRDTFQSTLPLREVTWLSRQGSVISIISIHTSPEGSDKEAVWNLVNPLRFQSTLPLREVTFHDYVHIL